MLRSLLFLLTTSGCLVWLGGSAKAQNALGDRIKVLSDTSAVYGTIETITRNEVTVSQPNGNKTVPVNDIVSLQLAGEPIEVKEARAAAAKGDYDAALQALDKVKADDVTRDLVRQEMEYLKFLYAARLAITAQAAGDDDDAPKQDPVEAAKQAGGNLNKYIKDHPNTMHYYEANETLGELLAAIGNYDAAATFFKELGTAPWPDYQARAELLRGRALQMQGKYDQALAAYDTVLKIGGKGTLAEQQAQEATIGRTYSLAGQGKADEAIKVLNEIIAKADDDDVDLLALAYNALGNCYRTLKNPQQALWAYLHVDLEYHSAPEPHAEALANLAALWTEMHRPDRARDARDDLQKNYPHSRWTKRGK